MDDREILRAMRSIQDKKYSVLGVEAIERMAIIDPAGLVKNSEEYYNSQVTRAATRIRELGRCKYILLCGPSASGKTTTAHKLKHRLIAQGVGARVLSMDNFYKGMEHYPKLADGSPDMESVQALDMELLNSCFDELTATGESLFPIFDFATQTQRLREHHIALSENDVLIMEGIHALNPLVLANVPGERIFRIYVSVRTKFMSGEEDVLVPKDIRLMRRMARDSKFRNYPPIHTLRYWDHVVASERVNIDMYRDGVDLKMDNTIDYEVCVWHALLGGVMEGVDPRDYAEFPQMRKIFDGLMRFPELDPELIPNNSLLREFIGSPV
jgi:uridine kinase